MSSEERLLRDEIADLTRLIRAAKEAGAWIDQLSLEARLQAATGRLAEVAPARAPKPLKPHVVDAFAPLVDRGLAKRMVSVELPHAHSALKADAVIQNGRRIFFKSAGFPPAGQRAIDLAMELGSKGLVLSKSDPGQRSLVVVGEILDASLHDDVSVLLRYHDVKLMRPAALVPHLNQLEPLLKRVDLLLGERDGWHIEEK